MELYVNSIVEWKNETGEARLERVLWIDPADDKVVLIDIDEPKAWPSWCEMAALQSGLETGEARLLLIDPYACLMQPEHQIKLKHREHRDKSWNLVSPLVHQVPRVFDYWSRTSPIHARARRRGKRKGYFYDLMRRYWQRGQTKNALLPLFNNCGWRSRERDAKGQKKIRARQDGKPALKKVGHNTRTKVEGESSGVNITETLRAHFRCGIKLYYEKRTGTTLKDAYHRTLENFFHCGYTSNRNGVRKPVLPPASELPTYRQFRYWYNKDKSPKRSQVSRLGENKFNLKGRKLLGDSTQMAFGPGSIYQIDATIGDAYLVSSLDRSRIIGRPVIYFVPDLFSQLIAGFSVALEGPSWLGAMLAIENAASDKVSFCAEYGITIEEWEWPACHIPEGLLGDRGELEGYNADHLVNAFNIRIQNTAPGRADLKGLVEQYIDLTNERIIKWVPGAVRARERGDRDYRLDAVLDLHEFRKLILLSILDYNKNHRMDEYRKDEHMIADQLEPYPLDLWHWGIKNRSGHLRKVPTDRLRLNLLPEVDASITRQGLVCENLHYDSERAAAEEWFERAKQGRKKVRVARDPRNLSRVYLRLDGGKTMETFHLVDADKTFQGRDWYEAADEFELRRQRSDASRTRKIDSRADFHATTDSVIKGAVAKKPESKDASDRSRVGGIREHRRQERDAARRADAWVIGGDPPPGLQHTAVGGESKSSGSRSGYVPPAKPIDKLRSSRERRALQK
jgi:putative transposase